MAEFAWVTLATNDSYSLGALVLAHSLRQVGTAHQLAVLVTPGVTTPMRQKLATVFNVVQEVNLLDSKDEINLRLLKRPELGITFTKLHCWRLTQFEKCVFLDADTLVLVNSDELFEREEFSAAPDVGWPDCFNSGVFVYRPSDGTYSKLVEFAVEKGSFDGGDQGLLNLFFSDWAHKDISKHLPFIYNMCSTASYSYLPAFKQFGADVKIVHFIGPAKPWLQYFDTESRTVHPSAGLQHLQDVLQRWWDIFCSLIHPNLTPDMTRSSPPAEHKSPHVPSYRSQSSSSYYTPKESSYADHSHSYSQISDGRHEYNVIDPWDEYDRTQYDNNVKDPWDEYDRTQYDKTQESYVAEEPHVTHSSPPMSQSIAHTESRSTYSNAPQLHAHFSQPDDHPVTYSDNRPHTDHHIVHSTNQHSAYSDQHIDHSTNQHSSPHITHSSHQHANQHSNHPEIHSSNHHPKQHSGHNFANRHEVQHSNHDESQSANQYSDHAGHHTNQDYAHHSDSHQHTGTMQHVTSVEPSPHPPESHSHKISDSSQPDYEARFNNTENTYPDTSSCENSISSNPPHEINKTIPERPTDTSDPIQRTPALQNEPEATSTVSKEITSLRTNHNDDAASSNDSGLAGAFAQFTLGVKRTESQDALENHLRRQGWEVGNIDYMGRDSFDNIWSKICETLASAPPPPPPQSRSRELTPSSEPVQDVVTASVSETKADAPETVLASEKTEVEQPEIKVTPETPTTDVPTGTEALPRSEPEVVEAVKTETQQDIPKQEISEEKVTPVETSETLPVDSVPKELISEIKPDASQTGAPELDSKPTIEQELSSTAKELISEIIKPDALQTAAPELEPKPTVEIADIVPKELISKTKPDASQTAAPEVDTTEQKLPSTADVPPQAQELPGVVQEAPTGEAPKISEPKLEQDLVKPEDQQETVKTEQAEVAQEVPKAEAVKTEAPIEGGIVESKPDVQEETQKTGTESKVEAAKTEVILEASKPDVTPQPSKPEVPETLPKTEAAQVEIATPTETTPKSEVTPEVEASAQPQVEALLEPEAPSKSETIAQVEAPAQSEVTPQVDAPLQPEVPPKSETTPQVEGPSQSEVTPQPETPLQPEVPPKSETIAQVEAPAQSEVTSQAEAPLQPEVPPKSETIAQVEASTQSEVTSQAEAAPQPEVPPKFETTPQVVAPAQSEAISEVEAPLQPEALTKSETTPKVEAPAQSEAKSQVDAPVQPEASPKSETTPQVEPTVVLEASNILAEAPAQSVAPIPPVQPKVPVQPEVPVQPDVSAQLEKSQPSQESKLPEEKAKAELAKSDVPREVAKVEEKRKGIPKTEKKQVSEPQKVAEVPPEAIKPKESKISLPETQKPKEATSETPEPKKEVPEATAEKPKKKIVKKVVKKVPKTEQPAQDVPTEPQTSAAKPSTPETEAPAAESPGEATPTPPPRKTTVVKKVKPKK